MIRLAGYRPNNQRRQSPLCIIAGGGGSSASLASASTAPDQRVHSLARWALPGGEMAIVAGRKRRGSRRW